MDKMDEEQITPEEIEEYQEEQKVEGEESDEDRLAAQQEFAEAYGSPEPEEKHNQHTFLSKAVSAKDTVRTTFLSDQELGRPLFSVRFLLDMEDVSRHYLDIFAESCGGDNRIANYFLNKVQNITDSGMSNKGFTMNLNVTRKMDTTRTRVKGNIENLQKGGKRRRS
ncbi:hypothetical protein LCGC14_2080480 [marine sediment metagenome]|uniref:Uncharacterized protein n=1 Tax=marine sediment metagenome TaxID=412755 RepID=A0A0F9EG09_9ZZZZ